MSPRQYSMTSHIDRLVTIVKSWKYLFPAMPCRHGIRGRRWIRPLVETYAWSIWPHTEIVPAKGGGVVRTAQLNDNPFIFLSSTQRQAYDDDFKRLISDIYGIDCTM